MFLIRPSAENDFVFLCQLRKLALFEAVEKVFGWNETIQKEICRREWEEARPDIIEISGQKAGSYLVQINSDHIYLGRFYLLPKFQGQGIGSKILNEVLAISERENLPIKLCYLQGNRVGRLYMRLGFKIISEDTEFVHMIRPVTITSQ